MPFCAGGVTGLARGRVESMLEPALECVLDVNCISPLGSGRNNHQYDQSVLSVVAHATRRGKSCHLENIVDFDPIGYTMDETRCNDSLLGARRWRKPKPYGKYIDMHMEMQSLPERKENAMSLEMLQHGWMKPQGNSKWQRCLSDCHKKKENRDAWQECAKNCPLDHEVKNGLILMNLDANLDYLWYRIRKGVHCQTILCRTFYFMILFYSAIFLFSGRGRKSLSSKNT